MRGGVLAGIGKWGQIGLAGAISSRIGQRGTIFVLRNRHREPEWMDQPGLDPELHQNALAGLGRINAVSRSPAVLWPEIRRLAARLRQPLRMLDLACGGGDVILSLARRAQRHGLNLRLDGCDISPQAIRYAEERARGSGLDYVSFFELDALRQPLPDGYDVIACSLFLHHLSEADARQLLKKMAAAAQHLVLVNDLRRSRTGYALAWAGCRLLSRSPVVHVDGPRSVAAAFTVNELRTLAASSGLANPTVMRRWPQRMLLVWNRE